jgi:hypothetical protein
MNLVFDISTFRPEHIHFLETKKNIIMDGNFTKIIYSDEFLTMNGIYISFPIQIGPTDKIVNKNNIQFNIHSIHNAALMKELARLENYVVGYYKRTYSNDKRLKNSLAAQLYTGFLKMYKEFNYDKSIVRKNPRYVLKISGIWENHDEIGITYKFIEMYDLDISE